MSPNSNNDQIGVVASKTLNKFYNYCTKDLSLNIIGLMCLPPADVEPQKYFHILKENADFLKLKDLSMGMSGDYDIAIKEGSTMIRLGTALFGKRE